MTAIIVRVFKLLLLQLIRSHIVDSIPIRGNYPWSVVLCKFKDNHVVPHGREWFQEWLTSDLKDGSILRYFRDASNGIFSLYNSDVYGWFELPYTKEDVFEIVDLDKQLDKHLSDRDLKFYYKVKDICVKHARFKGAKLHERVITVINDETAAVFCRESGVLLTPRYLATSALAHEMTHSFNIGHSYSDKPVKIFPYSSVGEYDDKYDLMSTANAYMYRSAFGLSGPGLNGPHLDYLGWLPSNRVRYYGKNDAQEQILRISSLSVPHHLSVDYLLILLPYDRDNPMNVYTLELRTPTYNDKGIQEHGAVIIHKIRKRGNHFYSYVLTHANNYYELLEGTEWLEFIGKLADGRFQYLKVRVESIDKNAHTADIRITSIFNPDQCAENEIPRLIDDTDLVCVTDEERTQVIDNDLAQWSKVDRFGCLRGFVVRRATPNDLVCVEPEQKIITDKQNERSMKRKRFFKLPTWGLNMCQEGYVWRQLDNHDYVCVTPSRRWEAQTENKRSQSRIGENGGCNSEFVQRQSFYGDSQCVTREEKEKIQTENNESKKKFRYYGFFNGVDTVFNLYDN